MEQDTIDSSFLSKYKKEVDEAFRVYLEDINPFIVQFEILKNEFPIEVQNEIRSMYGHLCRAAIAQDEETILRNLEKVKSHSKRALLDCYKYSCIVFLDKYDEFFRQYKNVDLSYIDDGDFLHKINILHKDVSDTLHKAKVAELSNLSAENLSMEYQTAYQKAVEMYCKLEKAKQSAEHLKHRATTKDIISKVSFVTGVVGLVVGIVFPFVL